MIVAERKSIPELVEILKSHKKILILGCGTCVTVCLAGGEREVSIIASALRIASRVQGLGFEIDELSSNVSVTTYSSNRQPRLSRNAMLCFLWVVERVFRR